MENSEKFLYLILKNSVKYALKDKLFDLHFGRLKVYKDWRIAIRATIRGKPRSVEEKIKFINDSKAILIRSLKSILKSFGLCKKPFAFFVMYQLGSQLNELKEELTKNRERKGKKMRDENIGGDSKLTCLYNEEEVILLSPLRRNDARRTAMDLVYDIEEKLYVKNGEFDVDLGRVKDIVENYKKRGLEYQKDVVVVPLLNVVTTFLLFIVAFPFLFYFMYKNLIEGMPIFTAGALFISISFLPLSLRYYHKITSQKILIQPPLRPLIKSYLNALIQIHGKN